MSRAAFGQVYREPSSGDTTWHGIRLRLYTTAQVVPSDTQLVAVAYDDALDTDGFLAGTDYTATGVSGGDVDVAAGTHILIPDGWTGRYRVSTHLLAKADPITETREFVDTALDTYELAIWRPQLEMFQGVMIDNTFDGPMSDFGVMGGDIATEISASANFPLSPDILDLVAGQRIWHAFTNVSVSEGLGPLEVYLAPGNCCRLLLEWLGPTPFVS